MNNLAYFRPKIKVNLPIVLIQGIDRKNILPTPSACSCRIGFAKNEDSIPETAVSTAVLVNILTISKDIILRYNINSTTS